MHALGDGAHGDRRQQEEHELPKGLGILGQQGLIHDGASDQRNHDLCPHI